MIHMWENFTTITATATTTSQIIIDRSHFITATLWMMWTNNNKSRAQTIIIISWFFFGCCFVNVVVCVCSVYLFIHFCFSRFFCTLIAVLLLSISIEICVVSTWDPCENFVLKINTRTHMECMYSYQNRKLLLSTWQCQRVRESKHFLEEKTPTFWVEK